jgi:uncharacterized membrane-anchored protein YitT (DUF2179 family)
MKNKHAWFAAVLNFLLPGLGYLYIGRRHIIVSVGFFVLSIWVAIHDWNEITGILTGRMLVTEHFLLFIVLYPLVFAFDAFRDAMAQKGLLG